MVSRIRFAVAMGVGLWVTGAAHALAQIPRLASPVRDGDGLLDRAPQAAAFAAAAAGTTYYGGTFWAADSGRWEGLADSCWTFDSGVGSDLAGSSGNPHVDPHKQAGLHATMEGWTGLDNTQGRDSHFRRLTAGDPRWEGAPCVGAPAGLGGNGSFWAGVLPGEADVLCYASGSGYGNDWSVCIGRDLDYPGGWMSLAYSYRNETDAGRDFTRVIIDTSGTGDDVLIASHEGSTSGRAVHGLAPGHELPVSAGPVRIKFCVRTDATGSDEDGLHPTACGAFAVDDIVLGGVVSESADFETGDDGWSLLAGEPGEGGEWSDLVALADLPPPLTPCDCSLSDSVLVFNDLSRGGGHGPRQDNLAVSPWIDLGPDGHADPRPGKFVQADVYAELPLLDYVFVQVRVQFYPRACPETGSPVRSPWVGDGYSYYFGEVPRCTAPADRGTAIRFDIGSLVPAGASQLRIALGVVSACGFAADCSGLSNSTPWFDNVKVGVYGDPTVPYLGARPVDLPQDSFPENGTLSAVAPGRVDCNNTGRFTGPEPWTGIGDTLVVLGGTGGAEVRVQFAVRPGPAVDLPAFDAWLGSHAFEGTARGQDWYGARLDTAEVGGGGAIEGAWMTAYHEEDPNFAGLDTDIDPGDLDPRGDAHRLANDVFPDDLFTPGTRINLFYKARFLGGTSWFIFPDTSGGNVLEMEVLPSSLGPDSTFNCMMYVDHADGYGVQPVIEEALGVVLDASGDTFEGTIWDRFDVRASTSHQGSLGRPLFAEFGAEWDQLICYDWMIWGSGSLPSFNLTQEDADVLRPWMTLSEFDFKNLYLTGDDVAGSVFREVASAPGAVRLLRDIAGVRLVCGTYRDLDCPPGKPLDPTACVNLDPVSGAYVAGGPGRTVDHAGRGNGCPDARSFDVLEVHPAPDFGVAHGDEAYRSGVVTTPIPYASVANDAGLGGSLNYRTVVEGVSVHHRRDEDPGCETSGRRTAVEERLAEVARWMGFDVPSRECWCFGSAGSVEPETPPPPPTALLGGVPNPLRAGESARIRFRLERPGHAAVRVFDLQGRLVRTVFDGPAPAGESEAVWDGTGQDGGRVAAGIYFVLLDALGLASVGKLAVIGLDR